MIEICLVQRSLTKDREGELLYFADVCAGPGGFSEYILWRRRWHAKGFGMTLKGPCDFKLEDFYAAPSELFEPYYGRSKHVTLASGAGVVQGEFDLCASTGEGGVDGDGDITRPENITAFRNFVLENTDKRGLHCLMADGVRLSAAVISARANESNSLRLMLQGFWRFSC